MGMTPEINGERSFGFGRRCLPFLGRLIRGFSWGQFVSQSLPHCYRLRFYRHWLTFPLGRGFIRQCLTNWKTLEKATHVLKIHPGESFAILLSQHFRQFLNQLLPISCPFFLNILGNNPADIPIERHKDQIGRSGHMTAGNFNIKGDMVSKRLIEQVRKSLSDYAHGKDFSIF